MRLISKPRLKEISNFVKNTLLKEYMYILECADRSFYTVSTKNLDRRMEQHSSGEGANHTAKRLPIKLVYYEEYSRIDWAFNREKQVQGWNRKKKIALIEGQMDDLPELAKPYRFRGFEMSAS